MKPRRVLCRASGEAKCRCGLRRAYESQVTVKRRNRHGLLIDVVTRRSLCTMHGKAYAAKWKLEVNDASAIAESRGEM